LDDLVHAGVLGLFDAASKYNPDKKVVFHSYAKYRIKGAILDSLRQLDWASRDLRKRQKMVEAITRELCDKLTRTPTEAEIAQKWAWEWTAGGAWCWNCEPWALVGHQLWFRP